MVAAASGQSLMSDVPGAAPAPERATRVLVVDDEPQLLRALRINLAARHYDVDTADDGESALRSAAARPPDLVVLDLGLPDMDGVEVIRALRGWTPVPIIVLSGRAGSSDKVHALDAGADDYVTKPFSLDDCSRGSGRSPAGPGSRRRPWSRSAGTGSIWARTRCRPPAATRPT